MKYTTKKQIFNDNNLTNNEKISKYYDLYSLDRRVFTTKKGKDVIFKAKIKPNVFRLREDMEENGLTAKQSFEKSIKHIMADNPTLNVEKAIQRYHNSSKYSQHSPMESAYKENERKLTEYGIFGKTKKGVAYYRNPKTGKLESTKEVSKDLKYVKSGQITKNGKTISYKIEEFRGIYIASLWSPKDDTTAESQVFSSLDDARNWIFS